jgi:hypothetical protein
MGYLIAVDSVNKPKQFMLFKRALTNGFKLEMSLLKDKNFQPESIFSGFKLVKIYIPTRR